MVAEAAPAPGTGRTRRPVRPTIDAATTTRAGPARAGTSVDLQRGVPAANRATEGDGHRPKQREPPEPLRDLRIHRVLHAANDVPRPKSAQSRGE